MGKFRDLTGMQFGSLTVINRVPHNHPKIHYMCQCSCGNTKIIRGTSLTSGATTSCGCHSYINNLSSHKNSTNEYEFTSDTCIGYTTNNEIFLVDIDKFDLIKDISWYVNSKGYIVGNIMESGTQKQIKLHRLVTNCPKGLSVDHKRGNSSRFDNRLSNLRICTNSENQMNKPPQIDNPLQVKGVNAIQRKHGKRYRAQITLNGKIHHLGVFDTLKEAADAYDEAAKQLFGDFAYLNNLT